MNLDAYRPFTWTKYRFALLLAILIVGWLIWNVTWGEFEWWDIISVAFWLVLLGMVIRTHGQLGSGKRP